MSDNKTGIVVPRKNVESGIGRMLPDIKEWLDINVTGTGASWRWAWNDINYVTFTFCDVKNSVRHEFARKVNGQVIVKNLPEERICEETKTYLIGVPKANVLSNNAGLINTEVEEWLTEFVKPPSAWSWYFGDTFNDIKYSNFLFENIDQEVVILFKIKFG